MWLHVHMVGETFICAHNRLQKVSETLWSVSHGVYTYYKSTQVPCSVAPTVMTCGSDLDRFTARYVFVDITHTPSLYASLHGTPPLMQVLRRRL